MCAYGVFEASVDELPGLTLAVISSLLLLKKGKFIIKKNSPFFLVIKKCVITLTLRPLWTSCPA